MYYSKSLEFKKDKRMISKKTRQNAMSRPTTKTDTERRPCKICDTWFDATKKDKFFDQTAKFKYSYYCKTHIHLAPRMPKTVDEGDGTTHKVKRFPCKWCQRWFSEGELLRTTAIGSSFAFDYYCEDDRDMIPPLSEGSAPTFRCGPCNLFEHKDRMVLVPDPTSQYKYRGYCMDHLPATTPGIFADKSPSDPAYKKYLEQLNKCQTLLAARGNSRRIDRYFTKGPKPVGKR